MSLTEYQRAKKWRERLGMTVDRLAELSGYSRESILVFERGTTPSRTWSTKLARYEPKTIPDHIWQRYRNVCCGVEAQLKQRRQFSW